jgi:hypothetical protein
MIETKDSARVGYVGAGYMITLSPVGVKIKSLSTPVSWINAGLFVR